MLTDIIMRASFNASSHKCTACISDRDRTVLLSGKPACYPLSLFIGEIKQILHDSIGEIEQTISPWIHGDRLVASTLYRGVSGSLEKEQK